MEIFFIIFNRILSSCLSRFQISNPLRSQARSELRFWRGAEADKVKNPKQLYVINLGKVRKMISFCQRLKKLVILPVHRRRKLRFLRNFWRLRLKFKGLSCERRRRERKFRNILLESSIFSHLEQMAAQIVDLFARLGRCWSTLSTPLATGLNYVLCADTHFSISVKENKLL